MKFYLEIEKPDERYCDGCICLSKEIEGYPHCMALIPTLYKLTLEKDGEKHLVSPNCPLVNTQTRASGNTKHQWVYETSAGWYALSQVKYSSQEEAKRYLGTAIEPYFPTLPRSNSHTLED